MADMVLMEGVVSADAAANSQACGRDEAAAPNPAGLNLPLAGAVILHLALLTIALVMPRLGREREQPPRVYPVHLYSVAEGAATPVAFRAVPLAVPPRPEVERQVALPVLPPVPADLPPVTGSVPAITSAPLSAPVSTASLAVMAAAPQQALSSVAAAATLLPVADLSPSRASGISGGAPTAQAAAVVTGAGPVASNDLPVVLAHPLYRENPLPEYPPLARRRQLEGTVVAEVLVSSEGKVDALVLHESSGHALLDEAALKAVKAWRFEPGRRGTAPLAMKVLVPVRFDLR